MYTAEQLRELSEAFLDESVPIRKKIMKPVFVFGKILNYASAALFKFNRPSSMWLIS